MPDPDSSYVVDPHEHFRKVLASSRGDRLAMFLSGFLSGMEDNATGREAIVLDCAAHVLLSLAASRVCIKDGAFCGLFDEPAGATAEQPAASAPALAHRVHRLRTVIDAARLYASSNLKMPEAEGLKAILRAADEE